MSSLRTRSCRAVRRLTGLTILLASQSPVHPSRRAKSIQGRRDHQVGIGGVSGQPGPGNPRHATTSWHPDKRSFHERLTPYRRAPDMDAGTRYAPTRTGNASSKNGSGMNAFARLLLYQAPPCKTTWQRPSTLSSSSATRGYECAPSPPLPRCQRLLNTPQALA